MFMDDIALFGFVNIGLRRLSSVIGKQTAFLRHVGAYLIGRARDAVDVLIACGT
jgi:hypothetical protein